MSTQQQEQQQQGPALSPALCLALQYRSAKKGVMWEYVMACEREVVMAAVELVQWQVTD